MEPASSQIPDSLQSRLVAGLKQHQGGNPKAAESLYQSVLCDAPQNADALHLLGVLAYQSGRLEMAVDYIARAVQVQPSSALYYSNLGAAQSGVGQLQNALASLRTALRIEPEYAEARYNLAVVYGLMGQEGDAVQEYRQTLQIEPQHALSHCNLGKILLERGEAGDAAEHFRAALAIKPDGFEAHYNLGNLLVSQGKFVEAIEFFRTAVRLAAQHAESRVNLVSGLKSAERQRGAITEDAQAIPCSHDYEPKWQRDGRNSVRPAGSESAAEVLVLSFLNTANFGDRLGYWVINSLVPPGSTIHHVCFDIANGYRPGVIPQRDFDLLILGIGNSLFAPVLTDELVQVLDRVPRAVGIFGTQYRESIDRGRLAAILDRLDIWYARYDEDVLLYGRDCQNVVHLGDPLISMFPMARAILPEPLYVGAEITSELPLDRTVQRIQMHRQVFSARLHPFLCALTSAERVAYREQREWRGTEISGKFSSLLIDVFGRTFPEGVYFDIDREAVAAYKTSVHTRLAEVRETLLQLLVGHGA